MHSRTLMIVGAAEEHTLAIQRAQELNLRVFVTDGNPRSPGFHMADAYAVASTYDAKATVEAACRYQSEGNRIDGVMTVAADVPITVARVAEVLNLPSIGVGPAVNASDKLRMKECFRQSSVPSPEFAPISDSKALRDYAKAWGLPLVIKPVDSRGARGVQRLTGDDSFSEAFDIACRYSPTRRVMVEQYLDGPQISAEGFMLKGRAFIPALFDRNYEYLENFSPFIVENGGEMPSRFSREIGVEACDVMERAALALDITHGVIKGDLVVHEGRVKVIEIAARLSGGFFGTVATPASTGIDLVAANIGLALGEPVAPEVLRPRMCRGAAIRFSFPHAGRVRSVTGLESVRKDPSCRYAHVFVRPGDLISPITSHPARPAVVVTDGASVAEASANASRLIRDLRIEVADAE